MLKIILIIIIVIATTLLANDTEFYNECFSECCGSKPRSECLLEIRDVKILVRVALEFEDKFDDKVFAEEIKKEIRIRIKAICPMTTKKYYGTDK